MNKISQLIRTLRKEIGLTETQHLDVLDDANDAQRGTYADSFKPKERNGYLGNAVNLFERSLKQELERLINKQERYVSRHSQSWEDNLVGRGALAGYLTIYELYQSYKDELNEAQERSQTEEE